VTRFSVYVGSARQSEEEVHAWIGDSASLPGDRALVSERPGRIRVIERGRLVPQPAAVIEVAQTGEAGLMGLAVHPRFPSPPQVYAMLTALGEGGALVNRVIRLVMDGNVLTFDRLILDGIPGARFHDGGRLAFGPDGHLYIGTGDAGDPQRAQQNGLAGKVLRLTADGGLPADNPFPNSPLYTLGHRNVQGFTWHPETGQMFGSEHGPSGDLGLRAWDEVNVLMRGGNYGWPRVVGAVRQPGLIDPIVAWPESSVPPSGMAFWQGDLYVATLRSQALVRIRVEPQENAWRAATVERLFMRNSGEGMYGRLRDVVSGPDGALYVLTNNRDGRGQPKEGDDRILRIVRTAAGAR
jgi:glucose/arabinose dehydrogenase